MKKIIKKLILLIWFFFVWSFFIWNNISFAGNPGGTTVQKTADKPVTADSHLWLYQTLGRSLYTVTWPLIVIAGQFMDNQVVYGSFVGMDTLLWKIWNVMRTFANYIIWLILIFSIFTLFLWWKLEQFNPIKIIPQLVISAVLVNASWFLIWACIDVSNILTYSVWTLPLKIAWNKMNNFENQTIPTFWISLQQWNHPLKTWIYDKKSWKILPFCSIKALTWDAGIKVVWTTWWCVMAENMKYYKISNPKWIILTNKKKLSKASWVKLIPWTKFSDIQKKLGWMTWILWSLYGSITNLWRTVNYQPGSSTSMTMWLILKLLFLFALVIPLFTLAVLLIVRVVALWMFIIISPIVFLFTSVKSFEKFLWEKWKLSSLCCMVFMPVIVVFALSISFVFLSSLKNMNISNEFWITWKWNSVYINVDWNPNNKNLTSNNNIKMTFNLPKKKGGDSAIDGLFLQLWNTLDWIIRSIFSIWFMWVIVFAALKSCKITWWIASSIQSFSQSIAKAAPVIPTWIARWQSVSSIWAELDTLSSWPRWKQQKQYAHWLWEFINEAERDTSWTWDSHHIAQTSKAISKDFSWGSIVSSKLKTFHDKKYWNEKVSDLLNPKNSKELSDVAASLWMTAGKLRGILKDKKWTQLSWTLRDNMKLIKKEMTLSELKKIFTKNVINWSITLLQLSDEDKTNIAEIFKNNWYPWITIWQNEKLVKVLKDMWFTDEDIIRLLANKITWGWTSWTTWVSTKDINTIKALLN